MPGFIRDFPPEIRDRIYEELLVSQDDGVEPQGRYRGHGLHPSILRTCKMAYIEGSAVLYQKNVFRFTYRDYCARLNMDIYEFKVPAGSFERIKHLEIAHRQGFGQHLCYDASESMVILRYVSHLNFCLKTFRVALILHVGESVDPYNAVLNLPGCVNVTSAIAALHIDSKITVVINSDSRQDCTAFYSFARKIAEGEQWAILLNREIVQPEPEATHDNTDTGSEQPGESKEGHLADSGDATDLLRREHEEDEVKEGDSEEDSEDSVEDYEVQSFRNIKRYIYTWTIEPAVEATRGFVPKLEEELG